MNTLQHCLLLREIGIDVYMSNRTLHNARALPISLITPLPTKTKFENKNLNSNGSAELLSIKQVVQSKTNDLISKQTYLKNSYSNNILVSSAESENSVIESFTLLTIYSPSMVFVAEVKTNPLSAVWERSVKQFFAEIEYACTQVRTNGEAQYFSWPLSSGANMQLGEKQLQQLLSGFLQQRIADSCKAVVMFGDVAKRYVEPIIGQSSTAQLVATESLGAIFKQAQHKRALWQKLQAIFSVK